MNTEAGNTTARATMPISRWTFKSLCRLARIGRRGVNALGASPRIADAVNDRDGRKHCDKPQNRSHPIEQGADDYQDQSLRTFHKPDACRNRSAIRPAPGCS